MKIEEVQKYPGRKDVMCSCRITQKQNEFIIKNDISITMLVQAALKELMQNE